ncbi:putative reverse transcriptase domain-containing protein [Tanacetum coccineum]
MDGILIYSKSKEDHEVHLKLVLELLKKEKSFAKFSKYEFELQEVRFLRHVVNNNHIRMDSSYYRCFIANFSKISKPLASLTQKNRKYEWGREQKEAFQTLKDNLCNAPILSLLDGPEDIVVYCDVSNHGLGCVLMQRGKVIAYASRQLKIHEKNYTTHDLELGAVVFTLKTWRHYLYGTKSIIYMDHKSLQHIFDQKELNMRQQRWIELFSDFDSEASKVENTTTEMLRSLYQLMERKEDGDRNGRFTLRFCQTLQKALGTRLDMSMAYHPQMDGQSERTIQTLEDMLRAYHWSIRCALFEAFYGRKCRSPVLWAKIREIRLIGPELVRKLLDFKVEDQVLLKVSTWKGVKYLADANLHVHLEEIKVDKTLRFVEEPVKIIDR